jgi:hypothetical protein
VHLADLAPRRPPDLLVSYCRLGLVAAQPVVDILDAGRCGTRPEVSRGWLVCGAVDERRSYRTPELSCRAPCHRGCIAGTGSIALVMRGYPDFSGQGRERQVP